jgi:hypothetical protein
MEKIIILKISKSKISTCIVVLSFGDLVITEWVRTNKSIRALSTATKNSCISIRDGSEIHNSTTSVIKISRGALEH